MNSQMKEKKKDLQKKRKDFFSVRK